MKGEREKKRKQKSNMVCCLGGQVNEMLCKKKLSLRKTKSSRKSNREADEGHSKLAKETFGRNKYCVIDL